MPEETKNETFECYWCKLAGVQDMHDITEMQAWDYDTGKPLCADCAEQGENVLLNEN